MKTRDWIYLTDEANENRFALGLKGSTMIGCIGVNPSKAHPDKMDSTIQSVDRIARHNGYDGWLMLNLIPCRATDPKDIPLKIDDALVERNIEFISHLLEDHGIEDLWLCYGNLVEIRPYLKHVLSNILSQLKEQEVSVKVAGELTKLGHPRHPLYLKRNTNLHHVSSEQFNSLLKQSL